MYDNIIQHVNKHITLTDDEQQIFTSLLKEQHFSKKTVLLSEGEICQFEGYIQQGCVRVYYLNENGFEVTLSFAVEDWWVGDIASFQDRKPSRLYIETLEDTKIYGFTPNTKEELFQRIPKFERFFRVLVQRSLSSFQSRLINTISKSATERYLEFIKLYPSIPLRVPQYYIASYLGVSPEFVSTIRKRLSTKQ